MRRFTIKWVGWTLENPYVGSTRFRIDGKVLDRAGQQSIYQPGQSCSVETSHFNGLLFNFNPKRLMATISEISRQRVLLELAHPRVFNAFYRASSRCLCCFTFLHQACQNW